MIILSAPERSMNPPYSRNHSAYIISSSRDRRAGTARAVSSAKPSPSPARQRKACRNHRYRSITGSAAGTAAHAARPASCAVPAGTSRSAGARKKTVHIARS